MCKHTHSPRRRDQNGSPGTGEGRRRAIGECGLEREEFVGRRKSRVGRVLRVRTAGFACLYTRVGVWVCVCVCVCLIAPNRTLRKLVHDIKYCLKTEHVLDVRTGYKLNGGEQRIF